MPELKADPITGFKAPILFPSHCVQASTPSPARQEIGSNVFDEEQIHALRACSFASIVLPFHALTLRSLRQSPFFAFPAELLSTWLRLSMEVVARAARGG